MVRNQDHGGTKNRALAGKKRQDGIGADWVRWWKHCLVLHYM